MKKFIIFALALILLSNIAYAADLHLFYGYSCPYCAKEKEWLETIEGKYPELNVHLHEIYKDKEEAQLYKELADAYGKQSNNVPGTFIGDNFIVGYTESYNPVIETLIKECIETNCSNPLERINGDKQEKSKDLNTFTFPLIGEVDFDETSLLVSTAIIGFVDGFNPCSLWVLTFLLGIVIYSGSRKKIFIVGLTFLIVTSLLYGAFIVSILSVLSYVGYLTWIKILVALVALFFAIVNIKDYFYYKKGISFTISDKYKPKIYKRIRNVMDPDKSIIAVIVATIIMAGGITLVELPCTSGFPTIWANILAGRNISAVGYGFLLAIYLLIYLIDELAIFFIAVYTLKVSKFEEKHGRMLKLIGGMIMAALAIVLLVKPSLMEDIGGSILIFALAVMASFIIMLVHDRLKPRDKTIVSEEKNENKEQQLDKN